MSDHVLLNLSNEFGKEIKCEACRAFYLFAKIRGLPSILSLFVTSLMLNVLFFMLKLDVI